MRKDSSRGPLDSLCYVLPSKIPIIHHPFISVPLTLNHLHLQHPNHLRTSFVIYLGLPLLHPIQPLLHNFLLVPTTGWFVTHSHISTITPSISVTNFSSDLTTSTRFPEPVNGRSAKPFLVTEWENIARLHTPEASSNLDISTLVLDPHGPFDSAGEYLEHLFQSRSWNAL